jgi:hypothetical protein
MDSVIEWRLRSHGLAPEAKVSFQSGCRIRVQTALYDPDAPLQEQLSYGMIGEPQIKWWVKKRHDKYPNICIVPSKYPKTDFILVFSERFMPYRSYQSIVRIYKSRGGEIGKLYGTRTIASSVSYEADKVFDDALKSLAN